MQKKIMVLALALAVAGLLPGCAGGGKDTSGTRTSVSRTGKSSMTTGEMQRAAQDYIRDARYEADKYGHVDGKTDQATRDLTQAARDLMRDAGDAARDAGDAVGDAARDAGSTFGD